MKKISTALILTLLPLMAHAELLNTTSTPSVASVMDMQFVHDVSYYLNSATKNSPLLSDQKSIPSIFSVIGKSMPSVSYGRSYNPSFSSMTSQNVNVNIDLYRIATEISDRDRQIEKNKLATNQVVKTVIDLYARAINYEISYLKMKDIYQSKTVMLHNFEKLQQQGGIAGYTLTELKIELLELDLKMDETRNQLVGTILELYYTSGITISAPTQSQNVQATDK